MRRPRRVPWRSWEVRRRSFRPLDAGGHIDSHDELRHGAAGMIQSFACAETERLFRDEVSRRLPQQIQRVARRKLLILQQARNLNDLRVPYGNHLEALQADRKGQHSIRVNDQWRICFRWDGADAHDVEIVDYH